MRALLGLDPDEAGKGAAAAEHFERALGYYGIDFQLRLLRGPGSPWRKMTSSRAVLDEIVFGEIARRRADPDSDRQDILSLLVGARGEGGEAFSDREIRDQVMTLMFAGHDTSTSTVTFMLHELARHPEALAQPARGAGPGAGRGDADASTSWKSEMPYLDMVARRGAAPLPAGLDRPAPRRPRVRVRRLHRAQGRLRQLLLLGQPPHPRGLPRPRGLRPRALHPRAQGGAAARRLRPLRRRLADLHRQALRPDRGEAGGDDAAAAPAPRRPARPHDDDPPDADALARSAGCGCGSTSAAA